MDDILNQPIDDLDSLLSTSTESLDDLLRQDAERELSSFGNTKTIVNRSAHAAMLSGSPDQAVDTYRQVSAEMHDTGGSYTYDMLMKKVRDESMQAYMPALIEYLSNPGISDENKQKAAIDTYNEFSSKYNPRFILGTNSVIADVPNENVERENVRINIAQMLDEVIDYQNEVQGMLNREGAKADSSLSKALLDFTKVLLPFVDAKFTGDVLDASRGGEGVAYDEAMTLMGNSIAEMRDSFQGKPIDERLALHKQLFDAINESKELVLNDNDYQAVEMGRKIHEFGYYTDEDQILDNFFSMLDIVTLGLGSKVGRAALGKGVGATAGAGKALLDRINNAHVNIVKGQAQPTSVAETLQQTNPSKAIDAHIATVFDETGEAAEGLYGVSKEEAMANDLLHDIGDGQSIKSKTNFNDPEAELKLVVGRLGAEGVTAEEYMQAAYVAGERYKNIRGLTARENMFQFENADEGVRIGAVYGPEQGGWSSAEDAVAIVSNAVEGVSGVSGVSLLRRSGDSYIPVDVNKAADLAGEDYLVKVDYNYKYDPNDVVKMSELDVKYNLFDRLGIGIGKTGQGSLQAHLLDHASMLHPIITKGGSVGVNKAAYIESQLLEIAKPFAEGMKKLPKDRQELIDGIVRKANFDEKWPSFASMKAAGLTAGEIGVLRSWRKYWDTAYWLENRDMGITLKSQGFKLFQDTASNTELIAKPLSRQSIGAGAVIYDHTFGTTRAMSTVDLDSLYASGGQIAKLKTPIQQGSDTIYYVASANRPGSALIDITENTKVLNYKEGYYTVSYKDPHFIVKEGYDARGIRDEALDEVVATAANARDAELARRSLQATGVDKFYTRGDLKRADLAKDVYYQLAHNEGRTAQRLRGQRLGSAVNGTVMPDSAHILNPVDSVIASTRSLGNRVAMRQYLENTKTRFLQQYGDYLPPDGHGGKMFPFNVEHIVYRGGRKPDPKKLADARTTFNYINYLENGYINSIDDGWKNVLRGISEVLGEKAVKHNSKLLAKGEEVTNLVMQSRGPSSFAKNIAFQLYIATNPIRQFIVQSHQWVQLWANYGDVIDRVVPYTSLLSVYQMGYKPTDAMLKAARLSRADADDMFKNFQRSGMVAAIDKQNLVRGALADFADRTAGKDVKPLRYLRQVGFDAGEYIVRSTAFSAEYARRIKAGKKVSQNELNDIVGRAENYTLNMNRSGDMPYNQNMLSLFLQFQQVPHKVATQMLTNRVLSPAEKSRLAAFNLVMYGVPSGAAYTLLTSAGVDPQSPGFNVAAQGLESTMINKLMEWSIGENPEIDFKSLAPTDLHGIGNVVGKMIAEGPVVAFSETPFGAMVAGRNPRLANLLDTVGKFAGFYEDPEENPTSLLAVTKDTLSLFSGASNAFKARLMWETNQKMNAYGNVTVDDTTKLQALFQLAGFATQQEAMKYWVQGQMFEDSKSMEQDIKLIVKNIFREFTRDGLKASEFDNFAKIYNRALKVYGVDNVKVRSLINQELSNRIKEGDASHILKAIEYAGWGDVATAKLAIQSANFKTDKERQEAMRLVEEAAKISEEINESL